MAAGSTLSSTGLESFKYQKGCELIYKSGAKPVDSPRAFFSAGQPGSGKSLSFPPMFRAAANANFVHIDPDKIRASHPLAYRIFCQYGEREAYRRLRNDVNSCVGFFIDLMANLRLNIAIEGTLGHPEVIEKRIAPLRERGYQVSVYVLATHARHSVTGMYERYERQKKLDPKARMASTGSHDKVYLGLLETLALLESTRQVDEIMVFNRAYPIAGCLYENRMERSGWSRPVGVVEAVLKERQRPMSNAEKEYYIEKWVAIITNMVDRGAAEEKLGRAITVALKMAYPGDGNDQKEDYFQHAERIVPDMLANRSDRSKLTDIFTAGLLTIFNNRPEK